MKSADEGVHIRQRLGVSAGCKGEVFAEAEIAKGGVLGEDGVARAFERGIAKLHRCAVKRRTSDGKICVQPAEHIQERGLASTVEPDEADNLVLPEGERAVLEHRMLRCVPGGQSLDLERAHD